MNKLDPVHTYPWKKMMKHEQKKTENEDSNCKIKGLTHKRSKKRETGWLFLPMETY